MLRGWWYYTILLIGMGSGIGIMISMTDQGASETIFATVAFPFVNLLAILSVVRGNIAIAKELAFGDITRDELNV